MTTHETPEVEGYGKVAVLVSAVVAVVVTLLVTWVVNGFGPFYESLFRVGPTVAGGGVGSDWVAGNTIGWLTLAIKITHAMDVLMGVFILVMVFMHWASFRRLAARMRRPSERRDETVVADGGERE